MGGMHAWMWGEKYPGFMDGLVPLASVPAQIAGRNRMFRRMVSDDIRGDPDWKNGDYTADDVVNPPELGLMEKLIPRVSRGRYILIPTGLETRGHGTHSWPAVWQEHLKKFLAELPAD